MLIARNRCASIKCKWVGSGFIWFLFCVFYSRVDTLFKLSNSMTFHDPFWVFYDQSLAAVFTVVSFNNHLFNLFSSIIMDKMHACVYFVDSYVIFSIFVFLPFYSPKAYNLLFHDFPWPLQLLKFHDFAGLESEK